MKRNLLLILVLFSLATTVNGQDPQFSQYYAAPLYLNPGFTGSTEQQRVAVNHRVQWPNLPQAFTTYSASYEYYDHSIKSGFGILATTDAMGSAGWRTTFVGLSYSFKAMLGNNWVFSPGLNFSYGQNGLDRNKLVMRDGLIHGDGTSYDPELTRLSGANFFDFSAGAVIYNESLWMGISSQHMNRPNISVIGDESELPMKVTVHGGMKLSMYNGPKKFTGVHYMTPSFIYRNYGGEYHQLDVGLRYHIDPIAIGLWYRGLPLRNENTVQENNGIYIAQRDAFAFITSVTFNGFQFGYSYDFSVSAAPTATGGAHEVSLSYEFSRKKSKKWKQKDMLIPCPAFMR